MEHNEFDQKLEEIRQDTRRFETSMRTSFIRDAANRNTAFQRVTLEAEKLRRKVIDIVNIPNTNTRDIFKRESVVSSAYNLLEKFRYIIDTGLPLDGDLFSVLANAHLIRKGISPGGKK